MPSILSSLDPSHHMTSFTSSSLAHAIRVYFFYLFLIFFGGGHKLRNKLQRVTKNNTSMLSIIIYTYMCVCVWGGVGVWLGLVASM